MRMIAVFFVLIGSVTILSAQSTLFLFRSELKQIKNNNVFHAQKLTIAQEKKSTATAVLYSLVIPGLGEWYVDRFDQGKYSLIAEAGLWLSYYSFQKYGAWIRDDSRRFAIVHANANIEGKSDQYFVDLGNFAHTYEYNEKKLIDRTPERLYDIDQGLYWQWDSDENRKEYRTMRVSSEKIFNNSKFVIGAVIVNHIISAVNAARLARLYNKELETDLGSWWMESTLVGQGARPDGIRLSLVHKF